MDTPSLIPTSRRNYSTKTGSPLGTARACLAACHRNRLPGDTAIFLPCLWPTRERYPSEVGVVSPRTAAGLPLLAIAELTVALWPAQAGPISLVAGQCRVPTRCSGGRLTPLRTRDLGLPARQCNSRSPRPGPVGMPGNEPGIEAKSRFPAPKARIALSTIPRSRLGARTVAVLTSWQTEKKISTG